MAAFGERDGGTRAASASSPFVGRELRTVHPAEEVQARIEHMIERIAADYSHRPFLMVVIEKGGRRIAARLVEGLRERDGKPEMLYLRAWRTEGTTLGEPKVALVTPKAFANREVLVVDDIVDEGKTLEAVLQRIHAGGPKSVKTAVLVSKVEHRVVDVELDYVGFELERGWIVGYGMDLDGEFRDLDHLAIVEPESPDPE